MAMLGDLCTHKSMGGYQIFALVNKIMAAFSRPFG